MYLNSHRLFEPIESPTFRERFIFLVCTCFYIFIFLVFFQPFGVNNYDPAEPVTWPFIFYMFLMSFIILAPMAINEWILFPFFARGFNRMKAFIWLIWSWLICSTTIFLLYNYLGRWHDMKWSGWLEFFQNTGVLLFLPIAGFLFYLRFRGLQASILDLTLSQQQSIDLKDQGDDIISLTAENGKDLLALPLKAIVYITSEDNYVAVHHLQNDQLTKTLLRTSIKRLELLNTHPALVRIHRSYLINLYHLEGFSGNQNNASLSLFNLEKPLPVARLYFHNLRQLFA